MKGLLRGSMWDCTDSSLLGRLWKRTDNIKGCLRKRSLDVWQARRMVQDRSVWQGFMRGNAQGVTQGMTL